MRSRERTILFVAWPRFDAAEIAFWRQFGEHLRQRGFRLVLTSATSPPHDLGVPHIPAPPTVDALWLTPNEPDATSLLGFMGLDTDYLLAREKAWGSPSIFAAVDDYRRAAMEHTAAHWLQTLALLQPAALVIWNGQHVSELILDAVARRCGVPVLYVERAPVPHAVFADEAGLSAASGVARQRSWTVTDAHWHDCAAAVERWLAAGEHTWWEQPPSREVDSAALRRQLGVPERSLVLLFAGQVDEDTQQFQFSPSFDRNESAFRWLLDRLRGRGDVFVLGKQHPKSRTPPAVYQKLLATSGVAGAWRTDISIADALLVADRVAAVNSTVLYEALARRRPVLTLGKWLLTGRGAAYEVEDPVEDHAVVRAWLAAEDADTRQRAWRHSLAFLTANCLYAYSREAEAAGMHGASHLAARIATLAERVPSWHLPSEVIDAWLAARENLQPWLVPGDHITEGRGHSWQRANGTRHQLLTLAAAVREGRRLVIWGTGAGGRLAADVLRAMDVHVGAFTCSSPGSRQLCGLPVIEPTELRLEPPRDMLLVASASAREIEPSLTRLGFTPDDDFLVVDCDTLAELWPETVASG